jgi:hypothetical protein
MAAVRGERSEAVISNGYALAMTTVAKANALTPTISSV